MSDPDPQTPQEASATPADRPPVTAPTEPERDAVDEQSEESFPASDPPGQGSSL